MSVNPPVVKKPAIDGDQEEDDDDITTAGSDVYEFDNSTHASEVLNTFNELRERGLFTDVILSASNNEFPCHRAVLVAGGDDMIPDGFWISESCIFCMYIFDIAIYWKIGEKSNMTLKQLSK